MLMRLYINSKKKIELAKLLLFFFSQFDNMKRFGKFSKRKTFGWKKKIIIFSFRWLIESLSKIIIAINHLLR